MGRKLYRTDIDYVAGVGIEDPSGTEYDVQLGGACGQLFLQETPQVGDQVMFLEAWHTIVEVGGPKRGVVHSLVVAETDSL